MAKDLIFEIGTEDLPPMQVAGALADMARHFAEAAGSARIEYASLATYGTPRRMALHVSGVAERQSDLEETRVGPPARAAFDGDGNPTKAALGFCRGLGIDVGDLRRVTVEKKKGKPAEYVAATVREEGKPSAEVLTTILGSIPGKIHWAKAMRWGRCKQAFARPVHWILARFGRETLEIEFANTKSGSTTRGHRFHAPQAVEVVDASSYLDVLRDAKVLADVSERRERIRALAKEAVATTRGQLREDPALLDEIVQLVEWPVAIIGTFDDEYLELPSEVLVTSMRKHQRYFAVVDENGNSLPHFLTIANTEVRDEAVVAKGNLRVLRARLDDAKFFFREDQKKGLDAWNATLDRVTYVKGLGSVANKVARIGKIAAGLGTALGCAEQVLADLATAARLAKADLSTGMVGEFPELQGFVGATYARNAGLSEGAAAAIHDHYAPRGASDDLPASEAGALLAIADRIDSIAALFALGRIPTGAADPFALRRAALGIIRIARERDLRFYVPDLVDAAAGAVEETAVELGTDVAEAKALRASIEGFFWTRLRNLAVEEHPTNIVDAVLADTHRLTDIPAAFEILDALTAIRQSPDFEPIAVAFKRMGNILGDPLPAAELEVNPELFDGASEANLLAVSNAAASTFEGHFERRDYAAALDVLVGLRPAVDTFFDDVLVNAEDDAVRINRHCLLRDVLALFLRFADVRRL